MSGLQLGGYKRLIVKVGSSLLVNRHGKLNYAWLESLATDIAGLVRNRHEVVVVSSGAVAVGCAVLGINKRRARLDDLQAAAAVGQIQLVHTYQALLGHHKLSAAQLLMTLDDTEDRARFLNARRTFGKLIERGIVPIVNENDTVATAEIRYGDNDRLAARIAQLVMADALILLSDIDGLYTADPGKDSSAVHVAEVDRICDATEAMAGESGSDVGSGGMRTKIQAARIATMAGCSTVIANGEMPHPLRALQDGGRFTIFHATGTPATARKQWLAGALEVAGSLSLDAGAVAALADAGSLLPVGVTKVAGTFCRGDIVALNNPDGTEIGRGLVEYTSSEAEHLLGCQSNHIEKILGYRGRTVMVHRDELVMFDYDG